MSREGLYLKILGFLYNEAEILDNERYEEWLSLLDEDFEYIIPVPETIKGKKLSYSQDSFFIKANKQKLSIMIKRLYNPTGWAFQDSASKMRRIIGNVRIKEIKKNEIKVFSNIVLLRIEGVEGKYLILSGEREDTLSLTGDEIKLKKRVVKLDSPNILMHNLYFPL